MGANLLLIINLPIHIADEYSISSCLQLRDYSWMIHYCVPCFYWWIINQSYFRKLFLHIVSPIPEVGFKDFTRDYLLLLMLVGFISRKSSDLAVNSSIKGRDFLFVVEDLEWALSDCEFMWLFNSTCFFFLNPIHICKTTALGVWLL